MATYFDSDRQSKEDYTNIKKVLDDVLPGYARSGGTFSRPIRRYGKHVFTHNTTFPCVKQPPGGQKDAYYALHHMWAIVRDHNHLLLPNNLKDWAASLSAIQDADIRQEFFRIQSEFADIIHQDVLHTSKASFWQTQIRITSSCLTFPSKSFPHRPVTYDFLDFDRSFFSNIPCSVQ